MTRRRKVWIRAVGFLLFCFCCLIFHFGPIGIKQGEDRVIASAKIDDGSVAYIVAHRTHNFIDAYEVTLFRVWPDNTAWLNWLGYEDGYWWGCSIRLTDDSDKLSIRAFGGELATYRISSQIVTWDDSRQVGSHKIDGDKVKEPVPDVVLEHYRKNRQN